MRGKKISFWSTLHGVSTTSNLINIALMESLLNEKKSLIMQTQFTANSIEIPLVGKVEERIKSNFYKDLGLDALLRRSRTGFLNENDFKDCSISLLYEKINLLVGTKQSSREIYETEIEKVLKQLLNDAVKYHDYIFIDTESGNNNIAKIVHEESDLIVVNLRQDIRMIRDFFDTSELPQNKVFYLFSNYDKNSKNSISNIGRVFKEINISNSAVIPYNIQLSDANSSSSVIKFLSQNVNADEFNTNFEYIRELTNATKKIVSRARRE